MASILILLYALNGITGAVSRGCFVAAWVLFGIKLLIEILLAILKRKMKGAE